MPVHGLNNSIFIMLKKGKVQTNTQQNIQLQNIMQLTKQQLIEAHEQGLNVQTNKGNIKIVSILGDVYGVHHVDTNSKLVKWWLFENFERNDAKIEQPKPVDLSILKEGEIYFATVASNWIFKFTSKDNILIYGCYYYDFENYVDINPSSFSIKNTKELRLPTESELELFYTKFPELKPKKYNGRAVKCDSLEQWKWLINKLAPNKNVNESLYSNYNLVCESDDKFGHIGCIGDEEHFILENYEIISFSQYCAEQGIKEPIWIQGFEAKDGYNDVVMCSDNNRIWSIQVLKSVQKGQNPFYCGFHSWKYCRLLKRSEINEIKFID
jgi:hypothetical protein